MIVIVRRPLLGLLRDADVMTFAFAIAIGWALYQVAHGVSQLVAAATTPANLGGGYGPYLGDLAWRIDGRVIYIGPLVYGLIELAVVLGVAAFAHAKFVEPPEAALAEQPEQLTIED
jgi:hypothetical protein